MLRAARCSSRGSSAMASRGTVTCVGESVLRVARRAGGVPGRAHAAGFQQHLRGSLGGCEDVGVSVGACPCGVGGGQVDGAEDLVFQEGGPQDGDGLAVRVGAPGGVCPDKGGAVGGEVQEACAAVEVDPAPRDGGESPLGEPGDRGGGGEAGEETLDLADEGGAELVPGADGRDQRELEPFVGGADLVHGREGGVGEEFPGLRGVVLREREPVPVGAGDFRFLKPSGGDPGAVRVGVPGPGRRCGPRAGRAGCGGR